MFQRSTDLALASAKSYMKRYEWCKFIIVVPSIAILKLYRKILRPCKNTLRRNMITASIRCIWSNPINHPFPIPLFFVGVPRRCSPQQKKTNWESIFINCQLSAVRRTFQNRFVHTYASYVDALLLFYRSETYKRLADESTKCWHFGPVFLYREWMEEVGNSLRHFYL